MEIEAQTVGQITFGEAVHLNALQARAAKGYQGKVTIDWGDYQKHGWSELAKKMTQISAQQLFIWTNQYPAILKELSHVSFPNLTKVIASRNNISSIECLIQFHWPNLQILDLGQNHITSARAFAKADLKFLQKLTLTENPLVNSEDFFKGNFSKLEKLYISEREQPEAQFHLFTDSVTWKIKLQPCLPEDQNFIQPQRMRGTQLRRPVDHSIHPLNYTSYREMLKRKGHGA